MKLIFAVVCTALAVSSGKVEARRYDKCELVRELYNSGIPKSQLADWVCLVQWESSFDTKAINNQNTDGSTDYGLFQINNRYWCDSHYGGNECNISCNSLLSDDISIAIECAKLIYRRMGFEAWYGWRDHCKGRQLPDISDCLLNDIGGHSGGRYSEMGASCWSS
ncbi:lysozyme c-1-like [Anopheles stephensi]|uniref:Lysozyme n=1 Tax=Anopheles stephensi TaxID=30069 RepID=A0A182XYM2_ANOST|nr:lysozyme c-1-like [Anopheles stephensi]